MEEIKEKQVTRRTNITDEERLVLASKLDKELDDFIAGLEKKKYTDGWPEDKWQEEMDKHPFFMKKTPLPGEDVHPLYEGIQQLKYDPEENTSEELAVNYKEDGNWYMKYKKYRMAVLAYTEGIKANCVIDDINAKLYNNRSAAQFFLKNYRTSLKDAEEALNLKSDYAKPKLRAAQCNFYLNRFDVCEEHCNDILENNPEDVLAKELLAKCKSNKQNVLRNSRKRVIEMKKTENELKNTIEELNRRNIKFVDLQVNGKITSDLLRPSYLPLRDFPVKADINGTLHWPTSFLIPQFSVSDFQQQLNENVTMEDCLYSMFSEPAEYDNEHIYNPTNINVYYENKKYRNLHKVDIAKTIKDIILEEGFYIENGSLDFLLIAKQSLFEEEFLKQYQRT